MEKVEITMTLGILAAVGALIWLGNHVSRKQFKIMLFTALYLYEVLISYKEADQMEFERYISAINTCKWYFWPFTCEVPPPDSIFFLKHMSPVKIAVRMFTTIISEPMVTISATTQTIINGITDEMWFPLNIIMHGILTIAFTTILVVLLVMIVFTYILNIQFSLSFLAGFVKFAVNEGRTRTFVPIESTNQAPSDSGDRISGGTSNRLFDLCLQGLSSAQNALSSLLQGPKQNTTQLQISNDNVELIALDNVRNRNEPNDNEEAPLALTWIF